MTLKITMTMTMTMTIAMIMIMIMIMIMTMTLAMTMTMTIAMTTTMTSAMTMILVVVVASLVDVEDAVAEGVERGVLDARPMTPGNKTHLRKTNTITIDVVDGVKRVVLPITMAIDL